MRTTLRLYLVLLIFTSGGLLNAQYAPPITKLAVPAATEVIEADGVIDDCYSTWQYLTIAKREGSSTMDYESGDDSDFNARFKASWSQHYLFLFIEVTDDVKNYYTESKSTSWTWDNVEVFIDLDTNSTQNTYSDTSTVQLRFCPGLIDTDTGKDSLVEVNGRTDEFNYLFWVDDEDPAGYKMEIAIPWIAAAQSGTTFEEFNIYELINANTVIGFDIAVADSDGDGLGSTGHRNDIGGAQMFWDLDEFVGQEDDAYMNRRIFGFIVPEGTPVPQPLPGPDGNLYLSPYETPVERMVIAPKIDSVMKMDANNNEASYKDPKVLKIFDQNNWTSETDLSGSVELVWDQNYLYLFADIVDDYAHLKPEGSVTSSTFDCIEIFADLDTSNTNSGYDEDAALIRINRGENYATASGRAEKEEIILFQLEKENTGWKVEAAIPWSAFSSDAFIGRTIEEITTYPIGFDIILIDSDNSDGDAEIGNIDARATWDSDGPDTGSDQTEAQVYLNTFTFGLASLSGEPTQISMPTGPFSPSNDNPVKITVIPSKNADLISDGEGAELFWSSYEEITLFNYNNWDGSEDLEASFRTAWDAEYLYFFADVTDDIAAIYPEDESDSRLYDNIEVYLDLDTSSNSIAYSDLNTTMLRFCRGMEAPEITGRAAASDFIYFSKEKTDDSGWTLEVAIPWTAALAEGAGKEALNEYLYTIGFDVLVSDRDSEAASKLTDLTQGAWDKDDSKITGPFYENLAVSNTAMFGIANLSLEPNAVKGIPIDNSLISIYPNPTKNLLNVISNTGTIRYEIINITGKTTMMGTLTDSHSQLNVSNLDTGIYILKATDQEGTVSVKKFEVR